MAIIIRDINDVSPCVPVTQMSRHATDSPLFSNSRHYRSPLFFPLPLPTFFSFLVRSARFVLQRLFSPCLMTRVVGPLVDWLQPGTIGILSIGIIRLCPRRVAKIHPCVEISETQHQDREFGKLQNGQK